MSSKKTRARIALLTPLVVALAGLATVAPAAAATPRTVAASSTAAETQTPAVPTDFVDLPTSPLPADARGHEVTVTYRNDSSADETVAPQLLVESPDAGPFLTPTDVKLERRNGTGCWKPVQLASQTGTLYTDLTTAQRTLHPGDTLTAHYRITVTNPQAQGTVHPRVVLFG
jgi:hypothetical protein